MRWQIEQKPDCSELLTLTPTQAAFAPVSAPDTTWRNADSSVSPQLAQLIGVTVV